MAAIVRRAEPPEAAPSVAGPRSVTLQPIIIQSPAPPVAPWWLSTLFLPMIPIVMTIIGWRVVARQNDRRERRRDIRELVVDLRKRVENVPELCSEYGKTRAAAPEAAILASKIKAELRIIAGLLKVIKDAGLPFDRWDMLAGLRQAATSGDFESVSRKPDSGKSHAAIITAAADLIDEMEGLYFRSFPIKARKKVHTP